MGKREGGRPRTTGSSWFVAIMSSLAGSRRRSHSRFNGRRSFRGSSHLDRQSFFLFASFPGLRNWKSLFMLVHSSKFHVMDRLLRFWTVSQLVASVFPLFTSCCFADPPDAQPCHTTWTPNKKHLLSKKKPTAPRRSNFFRRYALASSELHRSPNWL